MRTAISRYRYANALMGNVNATTGCTPYDETILSSLNQKIVEAENNLAIFQKDYQDVLDRISGSKCKTVYYESQKTEINGYWLQSFWFEQIAPHLDKYVPEYKNIKMCEREFYQWVLPYIEQAKNTQSIYVSQLKNQLMSEENNKVQTNLQYQECLAREKEQIEATTEQTKAETEKTQAQTEQIIVEEQTKTWFDKNWPWVTGLAAGAVYYATKRSKKKKR